MLDVDQTPPPGAAAPLVEGTLRRARWPGLTFQQWVICSLACLGFAFDTYELLVLPLIVRPAIIELTGLQPADPAFNTAVGLLFSIPSIVGGLFGLLGGYLTDRFGRRRVLVWSILLYACSAFASGHVSSLTLLLVLRCGTLAGVCVEFVAATAWLAELFPAHATRERILAYTQAFSSLGGVMVSGAYYVIATYSADLPAIHAGHQPWRYLLISGVIPALPLILVRPLLPESPMWQEKKLAGTLKRPSVRELFAPRFRRTTLVTTVMVACAYAATYGATLQTPRIVPGLREVRGLARAEVERTVGSVQFLQETGGLAGRFLLALLAVRIVSRRRLVRLFQVPGLVLVPIIFFMASTEGLGLLKVGTFVAGVLTVAQFSFWGNYLPRVYPTYLRGTGESFAANIGGRMIGTSAGAVTAALTPLMPGAAVFEQLAYACGVVGLTVFALSFAASFWLPEPAAGMLTE
jgi:MFS family permease